MQPSRRDIIILCGCVLFALACGALDYAARGRMFVASSIVRIPDSAIPPAEFLRLSTRAGSSFVVPGVETTDLYLAMLRTDTLRRRANLGDAVIAAHPDIRAGLVYIDVYDVTAARAELENAAVLSALAEMDADRRKSAASQNLSRFAVLQAPGGTARPWRTLAMSLLLALIPGLVLGIGAVAASRRAS